MPRLSRWFVKASLVYLAVGFTLGAVVLVQKGGGPEPQLWRLRPAHIELLVIGWAVQLAMGVAVWILPRFRPPVGRGDTRPAWFAFVALNCGVIAIAAARTFLLPAQVHLLGRIAIVAAAAAFAWHAWPRVKPVELTPPP